MVFLINCTFIYVFYKCTILEAPASHHKPQSEDSNDSSSSSSDESEDHGTRAILGHTAELDASR